MRNTTIRSPKQLQSKPSLALAACVAAALSGPAGAQQTGGVALLDDVVVTARKIEESVREVPISIGVLGAERLEQTAVTRLTDIEFSVPGLSFGAQGTSFDGARIGIRGVSSVRSFTGDQAAVAVHLDGIYLPQSGQAIGNMFDVQRVEVLKGPQGSLYGRNAVAGVINIVTRAPGEEFGGYVEAATGERSLVKASGAVDLPLADGHGLRLAVNRVERDGYVKNVLDDRELGAEDFTGGRLRYRGLFTEAVEVNATVQFGRDKSTEASTPGLLNNAAARTQGSDFYTTIVNAPIEYDREDVNAALQVDVELGAVTFRSVTGYSDYSLDLRGDTVRARALPDPGFTGTQSSRALSQEFNLFSTGESRIGWRVGAYYMNEKVEETRFQDRSDLFLIFPAQADYDDFRLEQEGDSYAVFGTLDFELSDALTLSVGARYNDETKEQTQNEVFGFVPPFGPVPSCATAMPGALLNGLTPCRGVDTREYKWSSPSGDVTLNWKPADDTLVYFRAARGFRSGAVGGVIGLDNFFDRAFGGSGTLPLVKLKEETLDSLELGTKTTFADGTVLFDAAAFYSLYKDQLVFTTDPVTGRIIEGNVGEVRYRGLDASLEWRVTGGFSIDLAANYTDAEVTELGPTVPPSAGLRLGNTPIYSPEFSGSAGLNFRAPVAAGEVTTRLEYNHKGKTYFTPDNVHFEDSVGLVNASVRFEAGSGWYVYASGQNLADEEYVLFRQFPRQAANGPGVARPGEPRTWEIGAGYRF